MQFCFNVIPLGWRNSLMSANEAPTNNTLCVTAGDMGRLNLKDVRFQVEVLQWRCFNLPSVRFMAPNIALANFFIS